MPSKIIEVSSANYEIRNSVSFTLMPLIFSFFLIFVAKNSAHIMKRYGERGSPWRHPRLILKNDDKCPDCVTVDVMFL